MNDWIISKILNYLSAREGCTVRDLEYTSKGVRAVLTDALGYSYEVHVKTLGRNAKDLTDLDEALNYAQNKHIAFKGQNHTFNG